MFSITDNERLRDAYALLMFMQSDIPAISSVPTMTAVWSLFSCPISWTRRTRWTLPTGFLTIII